MIGRRIRVGGLGAVAVCVVISIGAGEHARAQSRSDRAPSAPAAEADPARRIPAPAQSPSGGAPAEKDPALAAAEDAVRMRRYDRAVEIWTAAARRGNPQAAYQLGVAYRLGRGVPKDLRTAARHFEQAATNGDLDAQFTLGLLYRSGIGVERDPERALEWLVQAARAGHRQARSEITSMRRSGSIAYGAADPRVAIHGGDDAAALSQAIRVGDLNAAREALARGAHADGASAAAAEDETPLVGAIELGRVEIVRLLLAHRANPSKPSLAGEPPIVLATRARSPQLVRALLDAGASPDSKTRSGATVLMEAARVGRAEIVDMLVAAGADPRERSSSGMSASDVARRSKQEAIARRLELLGSPRRDGEASSAAKGVPASLRNPDGAPRAGALPPILEAARRGDARLLRELVAVDGALSIRDSEGNAPLHTAAAGGHVDCTALLLDAGADPNARAKDGSTPLLRAMGSTGEGSERVVALLLEHRADPSARDANGDGVVEWAARGATQAKLERVDAAGAKLDGKALEAALARAVVVGSPAAISALSARVPSPRGRLPALCEALAGDRDDVVALLVGGGIALDGDCGGARSPLQRAIEVGRIDRVRLLIEAGASPEYTPPHADPPLIAAASRGLDEAVSLLLERRVEVDRRGAHRMTALMGAATNGRAEAVRRLLDAGADPRMRSETDQTALDFAQQAGHADVVELLKARRTRIGGWLGGDSSDD